MLVSNSDNHKHTCEFAEESVRYLYGEMDEAQSAEFHLHLESCSSCSDELNAFSSIHSSIQNWKSAKFDVLSTPLIKIPTDLEQKSGAKAAVSGSWLANLHERFSLPVWIQAGAFAALIICLSFGLYFLSSFNHEERAFDKTDNKMTMEVPPNTDSKVAKTKESDSVLQKETDSPKSENPKSDDSFGSVQVDEKISVAQKSAPAKVSTSRKISKIKEKPVLKQQSNRKNKAPEAYANVAPVNNRNLPKLNNLPEEAEDEDLRLADLFDEIDAG